MTSRQVVGVDDRVTDGVLGDDVEVVVGGDRRGELALRAPGGGQRAVLVAGQMCRAAVGWAAAPGWASRRHRCSAGAGGAGCAGVVVSRRRWSAFAAAVFALGRGGGGAGRASAPRPAGSELATRPPRLTDEARHAAGEERADQPDQQRAPLGHMRRPFVEASARAAGRRSARRRSRETRPDSRRRSAAARSAGRWRRSRRR